MALPNLLSPTTVNGKVKGAALTTTTTTSLLTCAASHQYKIKQILVSNVDGTNSTTVTISVYDSSATTAYKIAHVVSLPAATSIVLVSGDAPIYLEESDEIRGGAANASRAEIIISYEDYS